MSTEHFLLLLEDLIIGISLVVTLVIYYSTRRADRKLQRAAYVRDYTFSFFQRPEIEEVFFEIDNNQFTWTDNKAGTSEELRLIRFLDFLNSLGFSCDQGVISESDIDETTLGYAVWRAHNNDQIQAYLRHVEKFDKQIGIASKERMAFRHFTKLALGLQEAYRKR